MTIDQLASSGHNRREEAGDSIGMLFMHPNPQANSVSSFRTTPGGKIQ
jgi:hypothetical protein